MVDSLNQQGLCQFEGSSQKTMILQYFSAAMNAIVLLLSIYSLRLHHRNRTMRPIMLIYGMLQLWLLCFYVKLAINIFCWYAFMKKQQTDGLRSWALVYFGLQAFHVYLLMSLLLEIPYSWISNLLDNLEYDFLQQKHKKWLNNFFKAFKVIKFYRYFRLSFVLLFMGLGVFMIVNKDLKGCIPRFVMLVIGSIQSLFLIVAFLLGIAFVNKFHYVLRRQVQNLKEILCEYSILTGVCLIRFSINILQNFVDFFKQQKNGFCLITDQKDFFIAKQVVIIVFMYNLPIFTIIYSYWPSRVHSSLVTVDKLLENSSNTLIISGK